MWFFHQILLLLLALNVVWGNSSLWEEANSAGMEAYNRQQYALAKDRFLDALKQLDQSQSRTSQNATTLNNLAAAHEALGEYEAAELRYRQSLKIVEEIQGPNHPDLVLGLNNLASLYLTQKKFDKAEPLWTRSLEILERHLGPDHPHLIQPLTTLALLSQAQKDYDQAEIRLKRALTLTEKHLGLNHPQRATLLEYYASLLRELHREEEAKRIEQQARSIRALHPTHP